MKIPKLTKNDIVEIIWNDTHTPKYSNWMDEVEYVKFLKEGMKVRSVGIVTGYDKNYIYLVGDSDVLSHIEERTVCRAINIGRGLITEMNILKRA